MNLNAIQTALTNWVQTYGEVPCEWGRLPQRIQMEPMVLAYLGPITKLGHDERIQTYGDDGDNTAVRVVGVRRIPLRLSFRTIDQRLGYSARQHAELLRTAMNETSSFDDLRDADLAIIDSDPFVESDYFWSGRLASQVDLTVYFAARSSFADLNHDGSYIGTVNFDSEPYIIDEAGLPVLDENGRYLVPE